jgi:hypothetical protein
MQRLYRRGRLLRRPQRTEGARLDALPASTGASRGLGFLMLDLAELPVDPSELERRA